MFRRWIIRGFFIGLLLLLVAGWGVSTCWDVRCSYGHDENLVTCGVMYGGVYFGWWRGWSDSDGWEASCYPQPFRIVGPDFFWQHTWTTRPDHTQWRLCCMGFYHKHSALGLRSGPRRESRQVSIPFWFLIVVTGAGLWYAWKKTGPRRGARGFPVQAVGGGGGA